ncbi:BlaR1 peptidase M56 [Dyadobacter soli]|uniref:BlaR1 peptidase M56 n=1 Tax=Dyadobacter soli TaxID=659014 RepID=A0A1G7G1A8_9BACT|nr:M56 family metallopeptidase [Dyadobacter soli]SDE81795.1 BlaR1 peptidase M56 [Dyadobacter soli]
MEALHYLLKVNLCWVVFYITYWVLFRKHTFFAGNRIYLVASLLAGLCIPALELREQVMLSGMEGLVTNATKVSVVSNVIEYQSDMWLLTIPAVYLAGVLVMLFMLGKSLVRLSSIIRSGVAVPMDECSLVINRSGNVRTGSFSFLKWMVLSPEDYEAHFESIFAHELVHIRQWHSLDILLIEVLKVFFWFNPVLWFYKSSLQQVHEFLADGQAPDRDRYAAFMISYARQAISASVTSKFFNKSLLKLRIHMIYKERTPAWMGWKYLSVFPLLAVMVALMATRRYEYVKPVIETPSDRRQNMRPVDAAHPAESNVRRVSGHETKEKLIQKSANTTATHLATASEPSGAREAYATDSLPELEALISRLRSAVSNNDLKNADSLKRQINPIIWAESARLRKEQTENRMRLQELLTSGNPQSPSSALDRLRKVVMETSRRQQEERQGGFDRLRKQFEDIETNLRRLLNDADTETEKQTQEQIILDLIGAGVASGKENLSYRLHNMFLIVNGVEQPEALHEKLKSKYLKYGWMEWVYNWDGATGHRFTGVRFNG